MEEIWVSDIIYLEWVILRLRRCETGAINFAIGGAAGTVVRELRENLEKLFPKDKKARVEILTSFAQHADNSMVEGEALRTSAADLERFHRILASLESRRDKSLRRLAEYRGELGQRLRGGGGRLIEGEVLELPRPANRADPKAA